MPTFILERTRELWGGSSIDMLVHDVRYGLRQICKAPGFSALDAPMPTASDAIATASSSAWVPRWWVGSRSAAC